MRDDYKAYFGIITMAIYLLVYVHCNTCLFFYLISIDQTWIPIKDLARAWTDLYERNQTY